MFLCLMCVISPQGCWSLDRILDYALPGRDHEGMGVYAVRIYTLCGIYCTRLDAILCCQSNSNEPFVPWYGTPTRPHEQEALALGNPLKVGTERCPNGDSKRTELISKSRLTPAMPRVSRYGSRCRLKSLMVVPFSTDEQLCPSLDVAGSYGVLSQLIIALGLQKRPRTTVQYRHTRFSIWSMESHQTLSIGGA